jgi:hypothetical protein
VLKALLSYRPPADQPRGMMERISGFVTARDEDYVSLRELVELQDGTK